MADAFTLESFAAIIVKTAAINKDPAIKMKDALSEKANEWNEF